MWIVMNMIQAEKSLVRTRACEGMPFVKAIDETTGLIHVLGSLKSPPESRDVDRWGKQDGCFSGS